MDWSVDDMWEASDYIVASRATSKNYYLSVPEKITEGLRFQRPSGELIPLNFSAHGRLDTQTLRGVREMSATSAAQLSSLLPEMFPVFIKGSTSIELTGSEEWAHSDVCAFFFEYQDYVDCTICHCNFEDTYGILGRGFLYSQYLKRLEAQKNAGNTDGATDGGFVCFNCQTMLNCTAPSFSLERLKRLHDAVVFRGMNFSDEDHVDANTEEVTPESEINVHSLEQDIKNYAIKYFIVPAREQGETTVQVTAQQINDGMSLGHQVRKVCVALDEEDFLRCAEVELVSRSGRRLGSDATWQWTLSDRG